MKSKSLSVLALFALNAYAYAQGPIGPPICCEPAPEDQDYILQVEPPVAISGEPIYLIWHAPQFSRTWYDQIRIYCVDCSSCEPNLNDCLSCDPPCLSDRVVWWKTIYGVRDGVWVVDLPRVGQYYAQWFKKGGAAVTDPVPFEVITGPEWYQLTATPESVVACDFVTLEWLVAPAIPVTTKRPVWNGLSKDWVGIWQVDTCPPKFAGWTYTEGRRHGVVHIQIKRPGTYVAQYFKRNRKDTPVTEGIVIDVAPLPLGTLPPAGAIGPAIRLRSSNGSSSEGFELEWDSIANKRYTLVKSNDLGSKNWLLVQNFAGTGKSLKYTFAATVPEQYFAVRVD